MKILLVEDDEDKREQVIACLNELFQSDLEEVRSFQSALKALKENVFDLVLLDMTMPTFDINSKESGGRTLPFGGKMLLHEMVRRKIKNKVIIVTQFDLFGDGDEQKTLLDLDSEISKNFKEIYLGSVQYNVTYTGWKEKLIQKIKTLI